MPRILHDLLKQREEHVDQLIQSGAILLEVILVGLEYLFQSHEPADQYALVGDADLDAVAHLLHRVFPALREIDLCNVVYDTAEGALNDLIWRDIKCLENILSEELLVGRAQRVRIVQVAVVGGLHVLLADVLAPALLDLELQEDCRLGRHIIRAAFVRLYGYTQICANTYLFSVSGHVKESFTDALSCLNLYAYKLSPLTAALTCLR